MSKIRRHIEKALTWGELADFYDSKNTGRKARTLPMDDVFNWAKNQPEVEFEEERGLLFWRAAFLSERNKDEASSQS